MDDILFEHFSSLRLPKQLQLQRVRRVIREELTPLQRETLLDFYFRELTITEIAQRRGVYKSNVTRTLDRADKRLRRFLQF